MAAVAARDASQHGHGAVSAHDRNAVEDQCAVVDGGAVHDDEGDDRDAEDTRDDCGLVTQAAEPGGDVEITVKEPSADSPDAVPAVPPLGVNEDRHAAR